MLKNTADI